VLDSKDRGKRKVLPHPQEEGDSSLNRQLGGPLLLTLNVRQSKVPGETVPITAHQLQDFTVLPNQLEVD
jgi:hypothetical protein